MNTREPNAPDGRGTDFIRAMVAEDAARSKYDGRVVTRFPPEPNGYLHIGHAKSICLNFGLAQEFGGRTHLRFDDTNPETEDIHYVESIINDVKWLGFDWGEHLYFASDYFEAMYHFAEHLITIGRAYVDSSSEEEIREARGTVTQPGVPTKYRERTIEENLDLFRRMRAGEFPDGAHVLRAKIDLASPNMLMRDPILYRIRHAEHYRTGDKWCIYPLYDYAHPIEDAIENVTHSLCTLEFENNREIYDWIVDHLPREGEWRIPLDSRPEQTEFARLALDYTVMSKRKLLQLVDDALVSGWDDPRMPTIAGMRRRGVTPEALRLFADLIGVAKANSRVDIAKLEWAIREDLNARVPRVLGVLRPLKVTITNYPEGQTEEFDAPYYPHDVPLEGSRKLPFSRELYIDRDDFMENPPKGYFRLMPGGEVRLRYAYIIRCDEVVRDANGEVIELLCTYDPATRGGDTPDGRVVRGTIQWLSAAHALPAEVRLYDRLFRVPDPDSFGNDFREAINPDSLVVLPNALVEPSIANDPPGSRYQFERLGYFCSDPVDSKPGALVFNRTVTLRDSWTKAAATDGRPERAPAKPKVVKPAAEAPQPLTALEIIARDPAVQQLFDEALETYRNEDAVAAFIANEIPHVRGDRAIEDLPFRGRDIGMLVEMIATGMITAAVGREVLQTLASEGGDPRAIVEVRGLTQISNPSDLAPIVDAVVADNADKVTAYRAGKVGLLGFFVGQVMARTGGRANADIARKEILIRLER